MSLDISNIDEAFSQLNEHGNGNTGRIAKHETELGNSSISTNVGTIDVNGITHNYDIKRKGSYDNRNTIDSSFSNGETTGSTSDFEKENKGSYNESISSNRPDSGSFSSYNSNTTLTRSGGGTGSGGSGKATDRGSVKSSGSNWSSGEGSSQFSSGNSRSTQRVTTDSDDNKDKTDTSGGFTLTGIENGSDFSSRTRLVDGIHTTTFTSGSSRADSSSNGDIKGDSNQQSSSQSIDGSLSGSNDTSNTSRTQYHGDGLRGSRTTTSIGEGSSDTTGEVTRGISGSVNGDTKSTDTSGRKFETTFNEQSHSISTDGLRAFISGGTIGNDNRGELRSEKVGSKLDAALDLTTSNDVDTFNIDILVNSTESGDTKTNSGSITTVVNKSDSTDKGSSKINQQEEAESNGGSSSGSGERIITVDSWSYTDTATGYSDSNRNDTYTFKESEGTGLFGPTNNSTSRHQWDASTEGKTYSTSTTTEIDSGTAIDVNTREWNDKSSKNTGFTSLSVESGLFEIARANSPCREGS